MRRMRRYQACYAVSRLWVSLPGPGTQTMTASSGRAKVITYPAARAVRPLPRWRACGAVQFTDAVRV